MSVGAILTGGLGSGAGVILTGGLHPPAAIVALTPTPDKRKIRVMARNELIVITREDRNITLN